MTSDISATAGEIFFRDRPYLLETTRTIPSINRLASRHAAIIDWNRDLIAGATVIDLAAHDGRWSLAALDAGAARCIAIEARDSLVASAIDNAARAGVADRMQVIRDDASDGLARLHVSGHVVVFLLGYYYHTMDHMRLLLDAARLGSATIVIDTSIATDAEPVIRLVEEATANPRNTVNYGASGGAAALVGVPSAAAVAAMLRQAGYATETYDWLTRPDRDWTDLNDYRTGQRATMRGRRAG